jgi:hypothetical protein
MSEMDFVVAYIAAGTVEPVRVSYPMALRDAQDVVDTGNNWVAARSAKAGAPMGDRYVALNAESLRARA